MLRGRGFKNVHGITNDPAEAAGTDIFCRDIHDMSLFNAGEIAFLYSKETLEHLISPWCALLEMNRVLRPGGEYLHLISTGMEKQRESYHVSCFPDWLWFDLLIKAGFTVEKMLVGHATEVGFVGRKERDIETLGKIDGRYAYDLSGRFNGVKREALVL